jgi:hypothetical protein
MVAHRKATIVDRPEAWDEAAIDAALAVEIAAAEHAHLKHHRLVPLAGPATVARAESSAQLRAAERAVDVHELLRFFATQQRARRLIELDEVAARRGRVPGDCLNRPDGVRCSDHVHFIPLVVDRCSRPLMPSSVVALAPAITLTSERPTLPEPCEPFTQAEFLSMLVADPRIAPALPKQVRDKYRRASAHNHSGPSGLADCRDDLSSRPGTGTGALTTHAAEGRVQSLLPRNAGVDSEAPRRSDSAAGSAQDNDEVKDDADVTAAKALLLDAEQRRAVQMQRHLYACTVDCPFMVGVRAASVRVIQRAGRAHLNGRLVLRHAALMLHVLQRAGRGFLDRSRILGRLRMARSLERYRVAMEQRAKRNAELEAERAAEARRAQEESAAQRQREFEALTLAQRKALYADGSANGDADAAARARAAYVASLNPKFRSFLLPAFEEFFRRRLRARLSVAFASSPEQLAAAANATGQSPEEMLEFLEQRNRWALFESEIDSRRAMYHFADRAIVDTSVREAQFDAEMRSGPRVMSAKTPTTTTSTSDANVSTTAGASVTPSVLFTRTGHATTTVSVHSGVELGNREPLQVAPDRRLAATPQPQKSVPDRPHQISTCDRRATSIADQRRQMALDHAARLAAIEGCRARVVEAFIHALRPARGVDAVPAHLGPNRHVLKALKRSISARALLRARLASAHIADILHDHLSPHARRYLVLRGVALSSQARIEAHELMRHEDSVRSGLELLLAMTTKTGNASRTAAHDLLQSTATAAADRAAGGTTATHGAPEATGAIDATRRGETDIPGDSASKNAAVCAVVAAVNPAAAAADTSETQAN